MNELQNIITNVVNQSTRLYKKVQYNDGIKWQYQNGNTMVFLHCKKISR